jgi:hypothetical protein
MKTIIKTEAMLSAFDEQQTASIKASAVNFFESTESAEEAVLTYQRIIGLNPSYASYEMGRLLFQEAILEVKPDITENALNVRWNTFSKKLGIDKPKSDDADAIQKAKKRAENLAKEEAMFANMTIEDLTNKVDSLLKNHTKKNIAEAGKIQTRIDKMRKNDDKETEAQKAQLVKDLTAWAKDQSYFDLYSHCVNLGVVV